MNEVQILNISIRRWTDNRMLGYLYYMKDICIISISRAWPLQCQFPLNLSKKTGRVIRPKLEQNTNAVNIRRPFDPTAHELDANFRLTRFADLKGRGCKVPQEVLLKLLEGLADDGGQQDEQHFMAHMSIPRIGTFCPYTNC